MSDHSFNPFVAKKYGIVESILINNFIFWTRTNAATDKHYYENRFWCYGTPEYFSKYFIYLSPRQIKYALQKLVKSCVLIKNNFNKKGYDRTSWYSLSDQALSELNLDKTCLKPTPELIVQNCPMDSTKLSYGLDKIVRPIPDTKPDTKPECVGAALTAHTENLLKTKKQVAEEKVVESKEIKEFFETKFSSYQVTIEEMFSSCQEYYEQKNLWATKDKFMRWIKTENLDNYSKKGVRNISILKSETESERRNRQFIEYEYEKEQQNPCYKSKILEKERERERSIPGYHSMFLRHG